MVQSSGYAIIAAVERRAALRILHIYKDYDPVVGGIENHIKTLAEAQVQRGHDVVVLVTSTDGGTHREQREGVRVIKAARQLQLASTPLSMDLIREARKLAADVVNLHMPYPPGDLAARAVPGAPPLVVTYHSDIVRQRRLLQLYRPVLWDTLRRASRIIATSQPYIMSSPWLRPRAGKCRVVPLSVDASRFASADAAAVQQLRSQLVDADGRIVLAVGVLRYYKGFHVLLDAMTQLDATLVVVGTGPEAQSLRDLAQAFGVARRVRFVGRVSDAELPLYFRAADVFALPSQLRAEAFGIVQLEAMAAGLPVVSTELGTGTSVVNQHGRTGFVVQPGDPQALARALAVLLENPELRRRLGAQARQRAAAEFSVDLMVQGTQTVYDEALAERRRTRRGRRKEHHATG